MVSPTDGATVASRTTPILFEGYHTAEGRAIVVQAQHPATGIFSNIASTATTDLSWNVLDVDWYYWSVSAGVPTSFWTPGATGWRATLRAQAPGSSTPGMTGVHEDYYACLGQSTTTGDFERDCMLSGPITICTAGYLPFGSRRGPCPRRAVMEHRSDGTRVFHTLPDVTTTFSLDGVPTSIEYRGDAVSFIDVFDRTTGSAGFPAGGANVIRIRYPHTRTSNSRVTYDPAALAASLGVTSPQLPWAGARTIRQYDVGECSYYLGWREALNGFVRHMECVILKSTTDSVGTITLLPVSRTSLRPLLRASGPDAVRFVQNFNILSSDLGDIGNVLIDVNVRLMPNEPTGLTAVVEPGSVVEYDPQGFGAFGIAFGVSSQQEVEDEIRTRLTSVIPTAIESLIPPLAAAVEIHRIHMRPDGVEFVLAEDTQDPLFNNLRNAGLCARPDPMPGGIESGLHFSFFDPPASTDHLPIGDPGGGAPSGPLNCEE